MLERIPVPLSGRGYEVILGRHLDRELATCVEALRPQGVLLVSDENVFARHGARYESLLAAAGPVRRVIVPPGETSKSLAQLASIYDAAFSPPALERSSLVVALGGGMVGDLAGFAASTLLRGLPLLHIPTSLLAMVDSSIGGKTAINHTAGKNLIGSFWQPHAVLCDLTLLETLPAREFNSALAEVVKYAVIGQEPALEDFEAHKERIKARTAGRLDEVVAACIRHKARVVAEDEREQTGRRALLNFGHTLAHVLETRFPARFLHGEAVAIGMVAACRVSHRFSGLDAQSTARLAKLLASCNLPTKVPVELTRQELLAGLGKDKKRDAGRIQFVVVPRLGRAELASLALDDTLLDCLLEQP
ncbi:3-dehydroquinate synthase [bacterium]|nr:MAG: 3-dehydroquinate synthase [bacterium]RIK65289.1 MAG: 3-dehydroquinate synthase [Planctomycetota bacterium]